VKNGRAIPPLPPTPCCGSPDLEKHRNSFTFDFNNSIQFISIQLKNGVLWDVTPCGSTTNLTVQFFIIYVPSQQLHGPLRTQRSVVTREYWRKIIITCKEMALEVTKYNIDSKIIIMIIIIIMCCKIRGFHGGDCEECRLLGYKNPVRTSQETHYISVTESSQLMLCKI
jgi:hypothetical protein